MAAASRDLQGLLAGLDPTADVAQRHIWLINIFDWLRGDRASPQAAIGRVQLLLDAIEARPELRERLRAWWRVFTQAWGCCSCRRCKTWTSRSWRRIC